MRLQNGEEHTGGGALINGGLEVTCPISLRACLAGCGTELEYGGGERYCESICAGTEIAYDGTAIA
eukprot:3161002-Rhodomonas_salina.2